MTTYTVGSVTVTDRGEGRVFLLLHGGAGPQSVSAFADRLAGTERARVIAPTHPGFDGTPRPESLATIRDLATLYTDLLDRLDLRDVTVIGNSIGGWITAEMALADSSRIERIVLVDAVGIDVPEHPVVDFFALPLDEIADLGYHNPDPYRIDPSAMSEEQLAAMAGNRSALATYGGTSMTDPTLRGRLAGITVPTLVLWGDSDRIVDPDFGRAYAAAIPGSSFLVLADTGHVPQIETPDALLRAIGTGAVRVVGPQDGETTLTSPIRMRILEDGTTTGHRLGIGEITIEPHTDGPLQHRHAQHDEGFYVVSGVVRFTVGETSHDATAGTLVMVPPGAPHTFANPGGVPAVVLNTFTPDLYVNYFRDLRDMIEGGRPMTPDAVAGVMARYATEPIAP
ncbi:MAG TPA: alpha/beta fold hydrolase [Pseudonocardiaceae bacterium]|jgi:pimeloyl-ACP methyl ester carboxylesterase/mannose-6-phosphate isomerase-like protein (cupin superfamily)